MISTQKSTYIHGSGSKDSPIWIIADAPFQSDLDKGYIYSGGAGSVYRRMLAAAGIDRYHITSRKPDLDHPEAYSIVENDLNYFKPPIVIGLDLVSLYLCPSELTPTRAGAKRQSNLEDYAGSLLRSPKLNYEHYVIPTHGPTYIIQNWAQKDIITSLDLGKAALENSYHQRHGHLEALPKRTLEYELGFDDLIVRLRNFRSASLLSVDWETIYENKRWEPASYPITLGIASSASYGIAFSLWNWTQPQLRAIFRELAWLFQSIQCLGQNILNFDLNYNEMLGLHYGKIPFDTYFRHSYLWPELNHDLGFLVRQYTREPYHKESGKGWSFSNLKPLLRYNALDCCTTFEVYERQQEELRERKEIA